MPGRWDALGTVHRQGRSPAARARLPFVPRVFAPITLVVALASCMPAPDTSLLDAYLAPQNPSWAGLPPPSPMPEISRNTRLVGIATQDLRDVFGDPALVRTEGGVQYWRYSFAGCTLDLFVNTRPDGPNPDNLAEVAYFDLRPSDHYGNGAAKADCERLADRLQDIDPVIPSSAPIAGSPQL
jgi:hypothetical protein